MRRQTVVVERSSVHPSLGRDGSPPALTGRYRTRAAGSTGTARRYAGARHVYIKAATPRLNGRVERSHRIDAEEFYRMLEGVVIDDTQLFNDKLQEWEHFYNFERPHGALGGKTPCERLREKATSPM